MWWILQTTVWRGEKKERSISEGETMLISEIILYQTVSYLIDELNGYVYIIFVMLSCYWLIPCHKNSETDLSVSLSTTLSSWMFLCLLRINMCPRSGECRHETCQSKARRCWPLRPPAGQRWQRWRGGQERQEEQEEGEYFRGYWGRGWTCWDEEVRVGMDNREVNKGDRLHSRYVDTSASYALFLFLFSSTLFCTLLQGPRCSRQQWSIWTAFRRKTAT